MARFLPLLLLAFALCAQQQPAQEPPEEDEALAVKEYSFNPLQAEKELKVGNFYAKKGNWKGAAGRFREATRWNPEFAQAWLRLGEAEEKLRNQAAAREAYARFVELAPEDKRAGEVRRKLKLRQMRPTPAPQSGNRSTY